MERATETLTAIQALVDLDEFDNIVYNGFTGSSGIGGAVANIANGDLDGNAINQYDFTVTFNVRPQAVETQEEEPEVVEEGGEE